MPTTWKGKPPQGRKSYEMTWAAVQRKGAAPLTSDSLTVLEPVDGERAVRTIQRVRVAGAPNGRPTPVALRVWSQDSAGPEAPAIRSGLWALWMARSEVSAFVFGSECLRRRPACTRSPIA